MNTHIQLNQATLDYLPSLTHLQFAILNCLSNKPLHGQALRELLADLGIHQSGPSFYQLMRRMETSGLIHGKYRQKILGTRTYREREYTITDPGKDAIAFAAGFYSRQHWAQPE